MTNLFLAAIIGAVLTTGVALSPLLTGQLQVAQAQSNMTGNMTSGNATMSGNMTGNMTTTSGNQSSASGNNVKIVSGASTLADKAYDPNPVTVSKGTTITWTNDDSQLHTVTSGSLNAADKGKLFDSGYKLAPQTTFSHMFDTAGTFDYFCQLHPAMVGKVVVN